MSLGCFFFKQKTAYELRISDWSSDVCSSDLPIPLGAADAVLGADASPVSQDEPEDRVDSARIVSGRTHDVDVEVAVTQVPVHEGRGTRRHRGDKIGRATCRERGGPDV